MANSTIGFNLGISKDFGIMTHRRESLCVDNIGRRERFSQRLVLSSIQRPTRLMREPDGATYAKRHRIVQSTRSIIVQTRTSEKAPLGRDSRRSGGDKEADPFYPLCKRQY